MVRKTSITSMESHRGRLRPGCSPRRCCSISTRSEEHTSELQPLMIDTYCPPLSLHDSLPIWPPLCRQFRSGRVLRFHRPPCAATFPCRPRDRRGHGRFPASVPESLDIKHLEQWSGKHLSRAWNPTGAACVRDALRGGVAAYRRDRKSTRLNSSP